MVRGERGLGFVLAWLAWVGFVLAWWARTRTGARTQRTGFVPAFAGTKKGEAFASPVDQPWISVAVVFGVFGVFGALADCPVIHKTNVRAAR